MLGVANEHSGNHFEVVDSHMDVRRMRVRAPVAGFSILGSNCLGLESLRTTALLHRGRLLARLGRPDEAGADILSALELPTRDPAAPVSCIDLSPYFNGGLDTESLYNAIPAVDFLKDLPRGLRKLPGSGRIRFDLRGVVQLNNDAQVPGVPSNVEGIRISQRCHRLYFLHATHNTEPDGTTIGRYVLHYADGQKQEMQIVYGQDLRGRNPAEANASERQGGTVAWSEPKNKHRVYISTWENPRPDVEIMALDFSSAMTRCGPFLIAIAAQ